MARTRQADGRVHGVVVACRRKDGRLLCIRRSDLVPAPLKVCFPGGGIEAEETQESAVVREMTEELGITVQPIQCVWRWESPATELTLWGWTATWTGGQIKADPREVAEVLWLTNEQAVTHPDAIGSNPAFVQALIDASF